MTLRSFLDSDRETKDVSVGPISLDIELAREIGWDDDAIREAEIGIALISRGASMGHDFRSGRVCEHCSAGKPREPGVCAACGSGAPRHNAPFGEDR
jgi:hypothetical protein